MTSKDEFEKTKDKYIVTSKIRDVEDKLIVDTMLSELMSIPIMGPFIKVGLDDIIEATVKKREKELIDCIIKKRNITSEQVNIMGRRNSVVD